MSDLAINFDLFNRFMELAHRKLGLWAKTWRSTPRSYAWRDGIVAKRKRAKAQRQARLIRRRFA